MSLEPPDPPQCENTHILAPSTPHPAQTFNFHGPVTINYSPQYFSSTPNSQVNFGHIAVICIVIACATWYLARTTWGSHTLDTGNDPLARGARGAISSAESTSNDGKWSSSASPEAAEVSFGHRASRRQSAVASPTDVPARPGSPTLLTQAQSSPINERNQTSADVANLVLPAASELAPPSRSLSAPVESPAIYTSGDHVPGTTTPSNATRRPTRGSRACILEPQPPNYASPGAEYFHEQSQLAEPFSLQKSLFTGSATFSTHITHWIILFIAVNIDEVRDSEHDLAFVEDMIGHPTSKSDKVYFEGLSGPRATLATIKERFDLLYRTARDFILNSKFVVWSTGLGNELNEMCLLNGQVIDAEVFKIWLSDLHNESPNVQSVALFFDYCRQAMGIPSTRMQRNVSIVYSCSLGQWAYGLSIPSQRGIPRSCFWIGLLMASRDSSLHQSFKANLQQEIDRLIAFLEFARRKRHSRQCEKCKGGESCREAEDPEFDPQKVDWEQAGDSVVELAELLSRQYPQFTHKVFQAFQDNALYCQANNIMVTTEPMPNALKLENRTTQHIRGAIEAVDVSKI